MTVAEVVGSVDGVTSYTIRSGLKISCSIDWWGPPWKNSEYALFIHGMGESHVAWHEWVGLLGRQIRIIRPDLPGHGRSTLPSMHGCTPPELATDFVRLLDLLAVERVHLVTAKFGGMIGVQLAADFPTRVNSLSLLSAPMEPTASERTREVIQLVRMAGMEGYARSTQRRRLGADASERQVKWWTAQMSQTNPDVFVRYALAAGHSEVLTLASEITAPVLVITTALSTLISPATARHYASHFPDATLEVVETSGHHPAATHPVRCAQLVARHLRTSRRRQ